MSSTSSNTGVLSSLRLPSLWQIPIIIFALLVFRFLAVGVYRVYFHPLSKFPGPKIRAFTRIPQHIDVYTGRSAESVRDLHRKYGHVVRVNPNELSFAHPDAWKDIHGHGTKGTAGSRPHKDWSKYDPASNNSLSISVSPDADHTRMRKIFTPAFSDRALKQQEPLFLRYVDQLVSTLKDGIETDSDRVFDMVKMYNFTTFDVMGDLTFGESLHMLDNGTYDPWVELIFQSIKSSTVFGIGKSYTRLWAFFQWFRGEKLNVKRLEHFKLSSDRVTKRLEKGRDTEGVDLWDLVLSQKEGKGLTRGEMDANSTLFMLAGTETTATLLSGLTYFLLANPRCMAKIVAEIRSAFANANDMTLEALAVLPYLGACIKEALRMYPPVPLATPRLTPEDGSTIVGHYVPPNTNVGVQQFPMYTLEAYFKRPLEYIPERWLGDKEFENDQLHAVQAFSTGSRDCLGKNMALHEMRLLIAKVLHAFDLKLMPESKDWNNQAVFTLWEKKPLLCKLRAVI